MVEKGTPGSTLTDECSRSPDSTYGSYEYYIEKGQWKGQCCNCRWSSVSGASHKDHNEYACNLCKRRKQMWVNVGATTLKEYEAAVAARTAVGLPPTASDAALQERKEAKRKFPKVDDLGLTEDIETVVRQLTRLGVATEDDLKLLTKSPKMLSSKMLFALDEEDVDDIVKGMPLGQRRLIKKSIEAEKFDPKKSCTRVIFLVFVVDPVFS